MRRILILGGGFGGVAAARRLRDRLAPEDEVILVAQRSYFMMGFRKSWGLVGESPLEAGQRPLSALERFGINFRHGTLTALDPAGRAAEVEGQRLEADALLVALGAELAPEAVPGLAEGAYNVYDPQAIPRAAEAVRAFKGGRVGVGIFGAPYKCPPGPFEMALLLKGVFAERHVPATLEVFSPLPLSIPILGEAGCNVMDSRLAEEGVAFLANHKATAVEGNEVAFINGQRRAYDLLLAVPPHRAPAVVRQSGLTGSSGWVTVDPRTMATSFEGVYAAGDVAEVPMANGKPMPKAGVFAEAMGRTAADNLLAGLEGRAPEARFDGTGGCFLETGPGQAMMVTGEFLAEPAPQVRLTESSRAYYDQKRAYESDRLGTWFGH
jgi:sulfide:quinone oxidoreductase